MPVTRDQVVKFLNVDEPDYPSAARLGSGAVPYLQELARGPDPGLGVKAVYLASLIQGVGAADIIAEAAGRDDPLYRVVAAASLSRLPPDRLADLAPQLLADPEVGVRRQVVAGLTDSGNRLLLLRLQELAASLPQGAHKDDVDQAISKISP
jgi:hypothetical protein